MIHNYRVWKGFLRILTYLIISSHISLVVIFVFGKVWKAEFLGREFSHAMMPWCHQSAISWPRVKCLHKISIGQTIHGTARIVASLPNWMVLSLQARQSPSEKSHNHHMCESLLYLVFQPFCAPCWACYISKAYRHFEAWCTNQVVTKFWPIFEK